MALGYRELIGSIGPEHLYRFDVKRFYTLFLRRRSKYMARILTIDVSISSFVSYDSQDHNFPFMVELTVHIHQMIGSVGQSSLDHKGAFPRPFSTLFILSFVSRGRIVFHTLFPSSLILDWIVVGSCNYPIMNPYMIQGQ